MNPLQLNDYFAKNYVSDHEINNLQASVDMAKERLLEGTGAGSDFLGWLDLPAEISEEELSRLEKTASRLKQKADLLLVLGIGGSYLGTRACQEALMSPYARQLGEKGSGMELVFAGNHLSGMDLKDLYELLKTRDFAINVISKSGTTTETAVAFRLFKNLLIEKYGEKAASERIVATTDARKGALREESDTLGYETYVIPDDVGGRFSVLTPVGLLPLVCAGIDVRQLVAGARDAALTYQKQDYSDNDAMLYAAYRHILYQKGYSIEVLANYQPRLAMLMEWWKQLFGESEGKDKQGIFPASVNLTTDLHSMGQYIQDGKRQLMETVVYIVETGAEIFLPESASNLDGLNFLAGKSIESINQSAMEGTLLAHSDGGVPNLVLSLAKLDAYHIGYLFYFFEFAVGISGYLAGINPFDQPGVEAYKKNMFALLGKPGYEGESAQLEAKLQAFRG